ncbi:MAG: hypothetical protein ACRD2A_17500 [Vicinamibacterales bacterium]
MASLLLPLILLMACSDDENNGAETPTPSANAEAPAPPVPELEPSQHKIAEGTLTTTINSGAVSRFDPQELPLETGNALPACAAYVFAFGWQVSQPYPPDEVDIVWRTERMGEVAEVASGASGTASIGCGYLETVNNSSFTVIVDAHYLIAEISE